ncbi:MAG TPA: hypothetical protein ENN98_06235 [Desulfurivibrio alkaliphilus]|uniref:DUF8180 domain-containing protein n=1 Tax=Desulfurivibrio alkaliphilus TaxID=427923 RepID=A0A7C2XPD3_9BACT|nr:hypothetical protein [Desulfurivibrio alkaliphilus]
MTEKKVVEKLRVLLPHWIEHNQGHAAEFRKWSAAARAEDCKEPATLIDRAAELLEEVDRLLSEALTRAGGASPGSGGQHHHHHD